MAFPKPPPPPIEDILRAKREGRTRDYTFTHPSGLSIQADGADDHARALEMIGRMSELAWKDPAPTSKVNRIRLQDGIEQWLGSIESKNKIKKTRSAKKKAASGFAEWKQSTPAAVGATVWLDTLTNSDCAIWKIF